MDEGSKTERGLLCSGKEHLGGESFMKHMGFNKALPTEGDFWVETGIKGNPQQSTVVFCVAGEGCGTCLRQYTCW